ncbi:MAG: chemotaxis protein CheW [Pseudomonadota bacterium]
MSGSATTEVILYHLGQQAIASPLTQIQSVQHRINQVTQIPDTPDWLTGVAPVSGELLPLLDLSCYLGLSNQMSGQPATLLVCQADSRRYGVLVSRCEGRFHAKPVAQSVTIELPEPLQPYVAETIQIATTTCPLIDLTTLWADPDITEDQSA